MGDVIVWSSAALAVLFFLAWLLGPRLRASIEGPKHRFQNAVREYDRALVRQHRDEGAPRP
jgi:hypothetical protein